MGYQIQKTITKLLVGDQGVTAKKTHAHVGDGVTDSAGVSFDGWGGIKTAISGANVSSNPKSALLAHIFFFGALYKRSLGSNVTYGVANPRNCGRGYRCYFGQT